MKFNNYNDPEYREDECAMPDDIVPNTILRRNKKGDVEEIEVPDDDSKEEEE